MRKKKKALQAPKLREQTEENARRLDLDDPEGEQEGEGDCDHLPEDDMWQEPLETEPPELIPVEPPAPDEPVQDTPLLNHQKTWEARRTLARPDPPSPRFQLSLTFC